MKDDLRGAVGPLLDSVERFTTAARKYLEDATRTVASASVSGAGGGATASAAEAARTFSDFLRAHSMAYFKIPCSDDFGAGTADLMTAAPLFDMPAFGPTRELQQRSQRTAEAGRRMGDAQRRLQLLWSDALRDAATAFAARLEVPPPATKSDVLRSLYDAWIDCAEEAYGRIARSDSFCDALADHVNASSEWRAEIRASVEHWAKTLDLPTRSELNSLNRRLHSAEAQLRSQGTPGFDTAPAAASPCAAGCSPRDLVWQRGKLRLYRYRPLESATRASRAIPLLIVYALVNRPYMLDLQTDRSLIRGLLAEGLDVYLVDWGYPDGADRFTTLSDYIDGLLADCVERVLDTHRVEALNLLGVCQGGVFSLCFSALHPRRVRNLVTMVTPVDFHTPGDLLSKWVRKIDVAAWVGNGNVSGDALNQLFLSLMPFRLGHQKYVDLLLGSSDRARLETFMRVEQWIFDSPDQAGTAFHEFVTWFYRENRLVRNQLDIAGRKVDLRTLELPLLNLIGTKDHLVPRDASAALHSLVGSTDYTMLEFDLGHVGMYISASAQRQVPAAIAHWLASR